MNIVFLYSEVIGYTQSIIRYLPELNPDVKCHVVYWDQKRISAYKLESDDKVYYHPRSEFNSKGIEKFLFTLKPVIIYVSGWMDRGYLRAIYSYKNQERVKVVAGIDDQWTGSLRQYVGALTSNILFKRVFDYFWIAGKPQYYFSSMFGFNKDRIISNLFSADTNRYYKKAIFSKRLVYLGRFSPEKGSLNLVRNYNNLPDEIRLNWPLVLIGDGPEREEIERIKCDSISVLPFLQGNALLAELMKGGIGCSPSVREQWGLTIHEFALIGYPLLLSKVCGAATEFLIEGYNGFMFDPNDDNSFYKALDNIIKLDDGDFVKFGDRSQKLGSRINLELVAASLLSVLYK